MTWHLQAHFKACPTKDVADGIRARRPQGFVGSPWWDFLCAKFAEDEQEEFLFSLQFQWHLLRACAAVDRGDPAAAGVSVSAAEKCRQLESERTGKPLPWDRISLGDLGNPLTDWESEVDDSRQYLNAWELLVAAARSCDKWTKSNKAAAIAAARALPPSDRLSFYSSLEDIATLDDTDEDDPGKVYKGTMKLASLRWERVLELEVA